MRFGSPLTAAVLGGLLACLVLAAAAQPVDEQANGAAPADAKQVKLFDFANYKQIFKKTYSSGLEEVARMKYFMSGALRAFASVVNYKFRLANHFLAVNHMSDRSPVELDAMENKMLQYEWEKEQRRAGEQQAEEAVLSDSGTEDELPEFMPDENEDTVRKLRELVAEHAGEPEYSELAQVLGGLPAQRASGPSSLSGATSGVAEGDEGEQLAPRELPLDKLINTGAGAELAPGAAAKLRLVVPSDNPNYVPIELTSEGLVDEQLPIDWRAMRPPGSNPIGELGKFLGGFHSNLVRTLNPDEARKQDERAASERKAKKATEVYVDLRESNCLLLPRSQGSCGSCYAFASIAIMEFLRCKQTGQLVPLSEQYMIDCGGAFVEGIGGCGGGTPMALPGFVRNFGVHLRAQYPYKGKEEQCPYDEATAIQETGYLRPSDFSTSAVVPVELWPEALEHGPLLVGMSTGREFREYGGGVWSGKTCPPRPSHAVLVVGHGREDNRDYWLIRNSHGTTWGEQGYMKLDKRADCIFPAQGFAFGVPDPRLYDQVSFDENAHFKASDLLSKMPKSQQVKSKFANQAQGFGGGKGDKKKKH